MYYPDNNDLTTILDLDKINDHQKTDLPPIAGDKE
jgi:inward rectifier potassium channel